MLQNRFYEESSYDWELRQMCRQRNVTYQSFWTLTANPAILNSEEVFAVARSHKVHPEQVDPYNPLPPPRCFSPQARRRSSERRSERLPRGCRRRRAVW